MQEILSNPIWQGIAGIIAIISLIAFLLSERKKKSRLPISIDPRVRQVLINHVENFWIKGILEKSLHGVGLMGLDMHKNPQAVISPWPPHHETAKKSLLPDKSMLEIFHEIGMGRSLLILGDPGSGKTTMLLELARQLIDISRSDVEKPIPLVFNLSSWSEKKSLSEWIVNQLNSFYRVNKKTAQIIAATKQYILLLDGLDEVKKEYRNACVKAINDFRKENGLIQIAMCSRTEEYAALSAQLEFEGSVDIQPLTADKVNTYFERFDDRLSGVRYLLKKDTSLQILTKTPMMLSIISLTYLDTPSDNIYLPSDVGNQRKQIFDIYIARMFERPGRSQPNRFTKQKTLQWLAWLARKMIQHNQIPLLVDSMQPSWLKQDDIINETNHSTLIEYLRDREKHYMILAGIMGGLIYGLIVLLGWNLLMEDRISPLVYGLMTGTGSALYFAMELEIQSAVTLFWSWKKGRKSLIYALIYGLIMGSPGLFFGQSISEQVFSVMIIALFFVVLIGVFSGLSTKEIDETTFPNQSILQSERNVLLVFIIFVLTGGLGGGIMIALLDLLDMGTFIELSAVLNFPLRYGLGWGLLSIVGVGLIKGVGINVIQHYILRLLLFINNKIPWRLVSFLDYASDLILLHKVGGGYMFIHRVMMEHFSEMTD